MKIRFAFPSTLGLIAAVGLVLTACGGGGGKDPQALGARYSSEFASAPPNVKAAWDLAQTALKTNGYAVAIATLQALQGESGLTDKQLKAVGDTATAVSDRMYTAADKGDAQAQQQIDELRNMRRR